MIQITAIRLGEGKAHEHITEVRWRGASTSAGQSPREAIVDWLSVSSANQAVVADGSKWVHGRSRGASRPTALHPYLRRRRVDGQSAGVFHLLTWTAGSITSQLRSLRENVDNAWR
jgi:hypothetical protein